MATYKESDDVNKDREKVSENYYRCSFDLSEPEQCSLSINGTNHKNIAEKPIESSSGKIKQTRLFEISSEDPPQKLLLERTTNVFLTDENTSAHNSFSNYFAVLPDEIVLYIFKKLPKIQLSSLALVCRRFNQLIQDESLWTKMDLSNKTLKQGAIGIVMSRQVITLSLAKSQILFPPIIPHVKAALPSFSWRLMYLDLTDATVTIACLVIMFSKCSKLRKLSLENVHISDSVLSALSRNKDLEVINFAMSKGLNKDGLKCLLTHCRKLRELNLFWCPLSSESIDFICANLPSTIHSFSIPCTRIKDQNVSQLALTCPNLQQLDLSDSPLITGIVVKELSKLEKLKFLDLTCCYQISYNSLLSLKKRKGLRLVDTNGNYINYYGFKVNKGITLSSIARPTKRYQKSTIWNIKIGD